MIPEVTQYLKDTENSLRDLISMLLEENFGKDWIIKCGVTGDRLKIWSELTADKGIIDSDRNPFAINLWIEQGYSFTKRRQNQLPLLFEKDKKYIEALPLNDGKYVAFVAIRWGFACLLNKKLTPTEKWSNRYIYVGHGRPLK